MVACSVKICKNRSENVVGMNIRFFSFPKNIEVAKKWIKACGKEVNLKTARICSVHFLPSCFKKKPEYYGDYTPLKVRSLLDNALPTEKVFSEEFNNANMVSREYMSPFNKIVDKPLSVVYFKSDNENSMLSTDSEILRLNVKSPLQNILSSPQSLSMCKPTTIDTYISQQKNVSYECNTNDCNEITLDTTIKVEENIFIKEEKTSDVSISGDMDFPYENEMSYKNEIDKLRQELQLIKEKNRNEVLKLEERFQNAKQANEILCQSLTREKQTNKRLCQDLKRLKNDSKIAVKKQVHDILKTVFSPKQIQKLLNPHLTKVKWGIEDIENAINLKSMSISAYRYLSDNNYPLPGLSTLRKYVLGK